MHFQPVPTQSDLQSRIPGGRGVVKPKPYNPPMPLFGPGSLEYTRRKAEQLEIAGASANGDHDVEPKSSPPPGGNYAGAGSYF